MNNKRVSQAVIFAGGYGKRLAPFTDTNPKPMYPFHGIPFLAYLIKQIKEFGITDIVILLGYMADKIYEYFGDGLEYGVNIQYDVTPVEYETGKRIYHAKDLLQENFLLMYCDNYCPIDFCRLQGEFFENNAKIQLTAYANRDGYTKNNLQILENGKVKAYDKLRKKENLLGVDIGYAIVSREVIEAVFLRENYNFEAVVYPKLVEDGTLYATVTEHRYYSIGSWERIKLTEQFFDGTKTVFLDRDGTLNVKPPKACYIEKAEEFIWIDGAIDAVKRLKEAGYRIILITNQPGIARGNLTEATLKQIHEKMQKDLEKNGAEIDAIYYCPHNWDEGCFCRKPKPGLFYQAQKDYSLNLCKCTMIGDDERDMQAATAAGCQGILVSDKKPLIQAVMELLQNENGDGKR